jgi:23S rRNA A2030 N6-methylase RlmJ
MGHGHVNGIRQNVFDSPESTDRKTWTTAAAAFTHSGAGRKHLQNGQAHGTGDASRCLGRLAQVQR